MSKRVPADHITTAYSFVTSPVGGEMVFGFESAPPDIAEALRFGGPVVDVRATRVGGGSILLDAPERELEWLITLLAPRVRDAAGRAMDEAQQSLREDIDSWRVQPGAHPGRPVVEGVSGSRVEAWLHGFRGRAMCELEATWRKQEKDRQAGRLREMRRQSRWRWR